MTNAMSPENAAEIAETIKDYVNNHGGAHTIKNTSGTSLPQQPTLKTAGGLNAVNDGENDQTVLTDVYEEIEYTDWINMTPQQQASHTNAIILNVPGGGSSGGSGHTIENASGTDLTQRDTMKFGGGLSASDDSTNEKTVITDEYEEIPYSTWSSYTPEQQAAHPNAIITGAPECGYELPTASASTLGGVKIGPSVRISQDGTLSIPFSLGQGISTGGVGFNYDSDTDSYYLTFNVSSNQILLIAFNSTGIECSIFNGTIWSDVWTITA